MYVCFSNSSKEEVYKLDGSIKEVDKFRTLIKFTLLRKTLGTEYCADYIIVDTSPGIRNWSLNAMALADILFLTLKVDDLDIAGTKKMDGDVCSSFTKFGTKSCLIHNRIAGYCVPHQSLTINQLD